MASYKEYEPLSASESNNVEDEEEQNLLPSHTSPLSWSRGEKHGRESVFQYSRLVDRISTFKPVTILIVGYLAGTISVLLPFLLVTYRWPSSCDTTDTTAPSMQFSSYGTHPPYSSNMDKPAGASFPADIGSTEIHHYPPTAPTNAISSLFPTKVGYAGPTATGAEPALVMTVGEGMYPSWGGIEGLVRPSLWSDNSRSNAIVHDGDGGEENPGEDEKVVPDWIEDNIELDGKGHMKKKKKKFDIFRHWGNLTPFYSVPSDSFGISSDTGPEIPNGCVLKGVHILHRHGARYPTADSAWLFSSLFLSPHSTSSDPKTNVTYSKLRSSHLLSF
jgi:hypothetical protein